MAVDSANTPNQATVTDTSNYDIDINKLYQTWIVPLDAIRSFASINTQTAATLKNLQKNVITPQSTIQESRCHAFYRWIGFPVFGAEQIYNPGFDVIDDPDKAITYEKKLNIANNPLPGFNKLSEKREGFSQGNLAIFSIPQSVNAGVLALSSGGNGTLRSFIVPFDIDEKPFDTVIDNQSYQVDLQGNVGEAFPSLTTFRDSNGIKFNDPGTKAVDSKRYHIIKPFIVDARIDFNISPQAKLIAVPFVYNRTQLKVNETEFVKRPLLENIIINRFSVDDPTLNAGSFTNKALSIIADFPDIQDNDLIKLAADPNNILKQSEQIQLDDSINTIKSLMEKLVEARNTITRAQGLYYWLPAPSLSGPEGGSTVQGVFVPTVFKEDKELITPLDAKIFFAKLRDTVNSVTRAGNNASGEATAAEYGLPADKITFGPDTTDALGNLNSQNLETLTANRVRILSDANDALRTIEIIMGDFSGFGLCDIIAIIGSLNVMPKENLLSFLDEDAQKRALAKLGLQPTDVTIPDFKAASEVLAKNVKDFYNLMDKIYQDILNRGAST